MPTAMPTLGEPPKSSPLPGVIISALVAGLVGGGIYWWKTAPARDAAAQAVQVPAAPVVAAPGAEVAAAVPPAAAPAVVDPNAVVPAGNSGVVPPPTAAAPAPVIDAPPGVKSFEIQIHGALEQAIVGQVGKSIGPALTQVVNRALVWWVSVPGDLRKGDTLWVAYEERPNQEPVVHAVRLVSGKAGKTFEAYRYKANGEMFSRLYEANGQELEERLVDAPLDSYEQVTSLLRDGRRHKGVDFKTPIGTPVKATFDGVITRKTWHFRGNGNSLEVVESGGKGRHALFLHLSEVPGSVQPGQRVKRGQVIAQSGNTGHSFAPHLHYQLMSPGGAVLDPFDSHPTERVTLAETERVRFDKEMKKLAAMSGSSQVAGAGR